MPNKILNILVEGKDDEVFFRTFVEEENCFQNSSNPKFKYTKFEYHRCRTMSDRQVQDIIKTFEEENEDYEIFVDLDTYEQDERKREFSRRYGVDVSKVHLVIKVMEGWLLAGFSDKFWSQYKKLNRKNWKNNTENVTKKEFERIAKDIYGKKGTPKQLRKLLTLTKKSEYSFDEAKKRNQSLTRFYKHFGLKC